MPPSLRQSSSPATQEKVPEGYLAKFHKQKLFFLKRLLGPHIRQIRQGCASYSYTPRLANQRNMLVANIFARARAHTPPPARQVGFFFSFFFFFFFFFSEAPLRPASIKPGRMVHLYRAHTAHPKHLVFCKSLDANPVEKKKKKIGISDFFGSLWHVARPGHVSHDHATGTRGSSKVRCAFYTKIVGVFRQEPCH